MRQHNPPRFFVNALLLSSLAFFAACKSTPQLVTELGLGSESVGTPCENQAGGTDPLFARVYCVTGFDQAAVDLARNAAEFAAQQFDWWYTSDPDTVFSSFSFRSVRAEFAHSVGLSGKGETIAVVDTGFYVDHPELAGKRITLYGLERPEDDHGTTVAAIAAGINDGSGIMGIAYDASLHLTSFENSLAVLADATMNALDHGAIVQNNSWGYEDTDINSILGRPDGMSAEEAFANSLGVNLSSATSYLDALDAFTNSGVIVFSASNDAFTTSLGITEGLPLAFPQLEAGWITALNGIPTFNESGEIISALRLSGECFEMAASCLMAEGVIVGTSGANSYDLPQIGTSFAAPIISGGIAILAEAFPSLSGPEIRDRLLVTADNGFFLPDAVRYFTPDISHGYSSEYGHGFMNLAAALLPIGTVGIPTGLSVYDGTMSLQEAVLATGFAHGDAIATALADINVMAVDSLSGNFNVSANAFVMPSDTGGDFNEFELFVNGGNPQTELAGALKSLAFALDAKSATHYSGGTSFEVMADIGMLPERSGLLFDPIVMSEIAAGSFSLGMQAPISGNNDIAAYIYASDKTALGSSSGAGLALQFGGETGRLSLGASIMQESGSALGLHSFAPGQSLTTTSHAMDIGYSAKVNSNVTFDANAQIGALTSSGGGMWGDQENTTFSAYGMALNFANVFTGDDRVIASIRQPIAIDSGIMSVTLPQNRDRDGIVSSSVFDINLAPSDRQLDLGIEYDLSLDQNESIRIGAAYIVNSANITDESSVGVALSYSLAF